MCGVLLFIACIDNAVIDRAFICADLLCGSDLVCNV